MRGARVKALKRTFIAKAMANGAADWEAAEMWQAARRREKKRYRSQGSKG